MMWFQYPPICSGLATPEHFWLHKRCISVNFFPCFFVGLCRICLCANVLKFEYWHLFIACKNWLCGYKTWMKAIFSWMKNALFSSQLSPRNTGNCILGLWNSKFMPPDPPRRRGLTAPCWYSCLLYSNLVQWLSCPVAFVWFVPKVKILFCPEINTLLTKLVQSRWLSIGHVLLLCYYGPRHCLSPWDWKVELG